MTNTMFQLTDRDDNFEPFGERPPYGSCEGRETGCEGRGERCFDPYAADALSTRVWVYLCDTCHHLRARDV